MTHFDMQQTARILRDLASNDASLHSRAASVLGNLLPGDAVHTASLVEALASPDFRVVFWCLIALKRLHAPPAREIVEHLALSHPICGVRESALDYLVSALSSDEQLRALLTAALRDPERAVRSTAMRGILEVSGWTGSEKKKVLDCGAREPSWMWRAITAQFQGE